MWNIVAYHTILQDAPWTVNATDQLDDIELALATKLDPLQMDSKSTELNNSYAQNDLYRF